MTTTVSVFYDQFNFQEVQIAQENKDIDSGKLAIELLRTKEKDLRESIEFKKHDIEYRQEHDYATTAVRKELNELQEALQKNLSEQEELLKATPEITQEVTKRKESLFAFLGRKMNLEGGILEFIMSTLSAIFINLIAPLSLTAVTELLKKKVDKLN
jgi:transcriptional/translational regulatory protein YebC/TACO1